MNTFMQVVLVLTEVLMILQCSFMRPYTNSQIYSLWNIFPTASRFLHWTGLPTHRSAYQFYVPGLTDRSQPIRSSASSADRPMLSLSLNTPPQSQLEALPDLPDHRSGSSWIDALLVLLDLFDSARFDPSGRLLCSHGPSHLPCYCGVGASPAAFSSAWPSVDPVYPNQTSEPTRLPPIGFLSRPSWLSQTCLRSSRPWWRHLPHAWLALALSFRLLPLCPISDSSTDPPSPSTANPKSNSSSDSFPVPLLGLSRRFSLSSSAHRGDTTRAHPRIVATCPDQAAWWRCR